MKEEDLEDIRAAYCLGRDRRKGRIPAKVAFKLFFRIWRDIWKRKRG